MPIELGDDERAAYRDGTAPASFVDLLGTASYRCVEAAQRLGVFAALAAGPLPAPALASATDADPRGTRLLADALVAFGYLTHSAAGYANTPAAGRWLCTSEGYATVELFWQRVLFGLWDDLAESVRTGKPAVDFYAWLARNPETARHFQTMLDTHATRLADELVDLLPVGSGPVLDLGGGHARYAVALCERHPELTATVLDFPTALDHAAAGRTDRVTLRAGDYTTEPLGTGYDLVLLFNVLHGHTEANCRVLLSRVADALRPGGSVAILEHSTDVPAEEGAAGVAFLHLFSLNLFHGQGGEVHPAERIAGWLTDTGFAPPTTTRLHSSPGQHLILAGRVGPG